MSTNESNHYPNLTSDEITKFKEMFAQFDPNGSVDEYTASIHLRELPLVIRSLGFSPTESELKDMVIEAENIVPPAVPLLDRLRIKNIIWVKFCVPSYKIWNNSIEISEPIYLLVLVTDNAARDNGSANVGRILLSTFLKLMSDYKKDPINENEICDAFKEFDEDGSGKLSLDELKQLLTGMGDKLSEEEFEFMIKEANVTNSGDVKYEDFVKSVFSR